jgi:hypothetical protein
MSYTAPSITASGLTFAGWQAKGLAGHLEALIAAQAATSAPTSAPTTAQSGSGNTLAAGTYYVKITETNGIGETTASPESAQATVTSGQKMTVTFPALKSGNTARNVYVTPINGASSTEVLYATGVTTATFDCTVPVPANSYAVKPPTVNTTGLTYTDGNGNVHNEVLSFLRAAEHGTFEDVLKWLGQLFRDFNRGNPIPFSSAIQKLRHAHTALAILGTMCSEAGTLIDANPGTLGSVTTGIGNQRANRTWP